ncbi:hypothetical protein [Polymorphospora rubra]|uniref:hypothetical protein n=1 Tax=Polymorphospora rubra TaxID=338584 RepID=UPI001BB39711|nr:hypothetical protein [Polymorphospora rubra]
MTAYRGPLAGHSMSSSTRVTLPWVGAVPSVVVPSWYIRVSETTSAGRDGVVEQLTAIFSTRLAVLRIHAVVLRAYSCRVQESSFGSARSPRSLVWVGMPYPSKLCWTSVRRQVVSDSSVRDFTEFVTVT